MPELSHSSSAQLSAVLMRLSLHCIPRYSLSLLVTVSDQMIPGCMNTRATTDHAAHFKHDEFHEISSANVPTFLKATHVSVLPLSSRQTSLALAAVAADQIRVSSLKHSVPSISDILSQLCVLLQPRKVRLDGVLERRVHPGCCRAEWNAFLVEVAA